MTRPALLGAKLLTAWLYALTLTVFMEVFALTLQDLRTAIEAGDARLLRAYAHTLKGSSRTIGAVALGELGEQTLAESREQYMRHALSTWEQGAGPDSVREPARAILALEVLCLLFGDGG